MPDRLSPAQIRGARGMLGWAMLDLARAAEVSISTVKRVESADPELTSAEIHARVRRALERAGVLFLDDGEGVGLRLRPGASQPAAAGAPRPRDGDAGTGAPVG